MKHGECVYIRALILSSSCIGYLAVDMNIVTDINIVSFVFPFMCTHVERKCES